MAEALHSIAGEQVRAQATVGGCVRLMQQRGSPQFPSAADPSTWFPSDLTPVLLALNTKVTLVNAESKAETTLPLHSLVAGFIKDKDWEKTIIISIQIPRCGKAAVVKHYRVARRLQNSHALVNACLKATVTICEDGARLSNVAIWFGCVSANPLQAVAAQGVLEGEILSNENLNAALNALETTCFPKVRRSRLCPGSRWE